MNRDDPAEKPPAPEVFDPSTFADDTLIHDRREGSERRRGSERRGKPRPPTDQENSAPRTTPERRARKERRRRIDPTTFEKQYTEDELEFMNAMQQFKVQACKSFPSHGEVLRVAYSLGYRKVVGTELSDEADAEGEAEAPEPNPTFDAHIAFTDGTLP